MFRRLSIRAQRDLTHVTDSTRAGCVVQSIAAHPEVHAVFVGQVVWLAFHPGHLAWNQLLAVVVDPSSLLLHVVASSHVDVVVESLDEFKHELVFLVVLKLHEVSTGLDTFFVGPFQVEGYLCLVGQVHSVFVHTGDGVLGQVEADWFGLNSHVDVFSSGHGHGLRVVVNPVHLTHVGTGILLGWRVPDQLQE